MNIKIKSTKYTVLVLNADNTTKSVEFTTDAKFRTNGGVLKATPVGEGEQAIKVLASAPVVEAYTLSAEIVRMYGTLVQADREEVQA